LRITVTSDLIAFGDHVVLVMRKPLYPSERNAMPESPVRELRLALTVEDYDQALAFYRDVLGLPLLESWDQPAGSGAVLDAGRATLELLSVPQAELVDQVEVGARVAGPVRVALEVADSAGTARRLVAAGAQALAEPVVTPWRHRNVRLRAPDGMQLTLFTVLDDEGVVGGDHTT
jgi:lactoylglutathione lyase